MKNKIKSLFDKIPKRKKQIQTAEIDSKIESGDPLEKESPGLLNIVKSVWSFKDDEQENVITVTNKTSKIRNIFPNRWIVLSLILFLLAAVLYGYFVFHVADEYKVVSSQERTDISGTEYKNFGDYILRYNSDGITCLSSKSEILWSDTYNIQTPMLDTCETTAAVAEKEGTQVYLYNEDGLLGEFKTSLPIEKIRVAKQGVVSVILNDNETTWLNFYDSQGELIAENKTSIEQSGYPLDFDLSPDGLKLAVSYLQTMEGEVNTNIAFYNFDSVGKAEINNKVSEATYKNELVPEVCFIDSNTAVAFREYGFSIYKGKQAPEETVSVTFEQEILSIFYSDKYLGFVFDNDDSDFQMQLYNLKGKKIKEISFDFAYRNIQISGKNIILSNDGGFEIYNINGRLKAQIKYKTVISDVLPVKGFGFQKFLVLTQENTEQINIK